MGRGKTPTQRIENTKQRHVSFSKRKDGLIKKSHEISILCDIEIVVIIFSSHNNLFLYAGKQSVEEVLRRFINLPLDKRERLQNEEHVSWLVDQLNEQLKFYKVLEMSSVIGKDNEVDIEGSQQMVQGEREILISQIQVLDEKLGFYLKDEDDLESESEINEYECLLQEKLKHLRMQREILEGKTSHTQQASYLQDGPSHAFGGHRQDQDFANHLFKQDFTFLNFNPGPSQFVQGNEIGDVSWEKLLADNYLIGNEHDMLSKNNSADNFHSQELLPFRPCQQEIMQPDELFLGPYEDNQHFFDEFVNNNFPGAGINREPQTGINASNPGSLGENTGYRGNGF